MRLILLSLGLAVLFANLSLAHPKDTSRCSAQENWHGHLCSQDDEVEFPGNDILGEPQDPEPPEPDYGGHEEDEETDEGPVPR